MDAGLEARTARLVTWLLLAATLLVGVAHIAFLPPWEGFDETAHWSYVQELADAGRPPRYGADGLSEDTYRYAGPMSYRSAVPFEATGRPTYRSYREAGARPVVGGPSRYTSGRELNWQAQHPPLYYALLAPLHDLLRGAGWLDELMALRLASFAFAYVGLAVGVLVAQRRGRVGRPGFGPWTAPIMAAWPFLFPQFFPEFARLGNDSLCLLFTGAAWALTLRFLDGEADWLTAAALGLTLGLGLLTKAFFLPIGAGVGVLLLAQAWRGGRRAHDLGRALAAGIVAAAVGGWWYVAKRLETGSFTGADEFIRLGRTGGLATMAQGYSTAELIQGLATLPATFLWAGTWSLARLPDILLLIPAALLGWTAIGYLRRLRQADLVGWTPLAFAVPMAVGLVYHIYAWMAGVSAVTPGWYFHILAAPLGFAVALGWRGPRVLAALVTLTGAYTMLAWAWQLSLFSGCAAKLGLDKHYTLSGANCFIDLHALSAVARPGLGVPTAGLGALLAITAGVVAWRAIRPPVSSEPEALAAL